MCVFVRVCSVITCYTDPTLRPCVCGMCMCKNNIRLSSADSPPPPPPPVPSVHTTFLSVPLRTGSADTFSGFRRVVASLHKCNLATTTSYRVLKLLNRVQLLLLSSCRAEADLTRCLHISLMVTTVWRIVLFVCSFFPYPRVRFVLVVCDIAGMLYNAADSDSVTAGFTRCCCCV